MRFRFFDFEVFENWWCCTFGDLPENVTDVSQLNESIKDTFVVVRSDDNNARDTLINLMKQEGWCNAGYNIKSYDLMIANGIYQGFEPYLIHIISDLIITNGRCTTKEHLRMSPFAHKRMPGIVYLDLFDSSTNSLKDKEAILGLSVMETTVPFDKKDLTEEDKLDVILYNKQDVYASMYWYLSTVKSFVDTKCILGRKYNIPEKFWYTDTNAGLVCKALGVERKHFADEEEVVIELPAKIDKYVRDNVPSDIVQKVLTSKNSLKVHLFKNEVVLADGGIHSSYDLSKYERFKGDSTVLYLESNDEWVLVDIDGESYYPSMLVSFNTLSRCVKNPAYFDEIRQERFRIKHIKNKTKEEMETQLADKLILNTTYGASGSSFLPLYDPYQRTKTCRFGELFLLALACKIDRTVPSAIITQMNTDGIFVYLRRDELDMLRELMAEWTRVSDIGMEESPINRMWQRDVNNYVLFDDKNKEKTKGGWLNHKFERPGYVMISPLTNFVVGRAVCDWLYNRKDIIQSIVSCKNLLDFCSTTTRGGTYQETVHKMYNDIDMEYEVNVFKCNRVIATKNKKYGKLYKVKIDENGGRHYTQIAKTPDNCITLNEDMSHYTFDKLKKQIDYCYYLQDAADRLDMPFIELIDGKEVLTDRFDYFKDDR